ncbi:MAG: hypothetical protein AAF430_16680 [Myxococcota bacterium]
MAEGIATLDARTRPDSPEEASRGFDRLSSFRVTIAAIFAFMLFYILSVEGLEAVLDTQFRAQITEATRVSPSQGPIVTQIQNRVSDVVQESPWVRYGGIRVNVTVLGADGLTPLYVGGGKVVPPPPARSLDAAMREALELLPAISDVFVSVPHGSFLSIGLFIGYGTILLQGLFLYNRRVARLERERLDVAMSARAFSAERARSIEAELSKVRERLGEVEPTERAQSREIDELERERAELRAKLRDLGERESELRATASRTHELEEERQTLEDLLDEALDDVAVKEEEISTLQDRLKTADRKQGAREKGRTREADRLAKRLRTLYKNLQVDERAVSDLTSLGDESLKLRAEELLKRLDDDPESAAVRRKVGGLPPQLSIFELGFAGKGRIYYTRREPSGFRVLLVGGKATQKQDLEYLSRLAL